MFRVRTSTYFTCTCGCCGRCHHHYTTAPQRENKSTTPQCIKRESSSLRRTRPTTSQPHQKNVPASCADHHPQVKYSSKNRYTPISRAGTRVYGVCRYANLYVVSRRRSRRYSRGIQRRYEYPQTYLLLPAQEEEKAVVVGCGLLVAETAATTTERKSTRHQGIEQQPGLRPHFATSPSHQKNIKRAPSTWARRMYVRIIRITRILALCTISRNFKMFRNFRSHRGHVGFLLIIFMNYLRSTRVVVPVLKGDPGTRSACSSFFVLLQQIPVLRSRDRSLHSQSI